MRRGRCSRPADKAAALEGGVRDVTVLRIGAGGDGVAEHAGGHLYIPLTVPGDQVRVRPGQARGDGQAAELVELLSAGPGRAEPPCAHFGRCGGCSLQHLATEDYVQWKTNRLAWALERAGIRDGERAPLVTVPEGARRRATFAAVGTAVGTGKGATDAAILGFRVKRGSDVVDLTGCSVVDPRILSLLPALRTLLGHLLEARQRAEATVTLLDGDLDVVLEWPGTLGLEVREALAAFAAAADVARLSWRPSAGAAAETVVQRRPVAAVFAGVRVALPPGGFLQATREGEQALIAAVLAAVETAEQRAGKPARAVADLFCGAGAFAFPLARAGMRVHAIDADAALLQALTAARGPCPITAEQRDLFTRPLSASELRGFDAVVFDPPRAGAQAQAAELARSAVPVIAAVSCNPSTFARDARILSGGGYRLETVTPVDQFLWSPHLELVGIFRC